MMTLSPTTIRGQWFQGSHYTIIISRAVGCIPWRHMIIRDDSLDYAFSFDTSWAGRRRNFSTYSQSCKMHSIAWLSLAIRRYIDDDIMSFIYFINYCFMAAPYQFICHYDYYYEYRCAASEMHEGQASISLTHHWKASARRVCVRNSASHFKPGPSLVAWTR